MNEESNRVVVTLPADLLKFAEACAGQPDISAVVATSLTLLAERVGALETNCSRHREKSQGTAANLPVDSAETRRH